MAGMESGRVVSVNLAVVRTDPFTHVKSGRSGIDKRPATGPVRLEVDGVAGDTICDTKNHGGPEQAVYAYAVEDLDFWTAELERLVEPGNVGENLTLVGVDCSHAVIGERWQVGDAVLRVTGPRTPCRVFSGFLDVPDLIKRFFAAGRPGAYLAVEQPAGISAGDPVTVLDRPAHGVTTADLLAATGGHRELLPRIAQARADLGPRGQRVARHRPGGVATVTGESVSRSVRVAGVHDALPSGSAVVGELGRPGSLGVGEGQAEPDGRRARASRSSASCARSGVCAEPSAAPILRSTRPHTRSITARPLPARCTSTRRRSTGSVRRDASPESTSLSTTRVAVGAGSAVCEAISPMLRPPPLASMSSTRQPSRLTPSAAVTGARAAATARSTRSSNSTRPVTLGVGT